MFLRIPLMRKNKHINIKQSILLAIFFFMINSAELQAQEDYSAIFVGGGYTSVPDYGLGGLSLSLGSHTYKWDLAADMGFYTMEGLSLSIIEFNVGYNIIKSEYADIYPYAGIGIGLLHGDLEYDETNFDYNMEAVELSFNAGFAGIFKINKFGIIGKYGYNTIFKSGQFSISLTYLIIN